MGSIHLLGQPARIPELAFGIRHSQSKKILSQGHVYFPPEAQCFYVLYWEAVTGVIRATALFSSLYDFLSENPDYEFYWGEDIAYGV